MWIGLEGGMVGWGSESGLGGGGGAGGWGGGRGGWRPDIYTTMELFEKLPPDPGVWR